MHCYIIGVGMYENGRIMEGRCLCAIGRFASGELIKLRCATIGNNGMVRFTIEGSRRGTVYERPNSK